MADKLFQRLGINDCPMCGKHGLWLVEYECTMNRLNDHNEIAESFQDSYQVKLICPHCAEEFYNVGKKGMNYYIETGLPPLDLTKRIQYFNPFQI